MTCVTNVSRLKLYVEMSSDLNVNFFENMTCIKKYIDPVAVFSKIKSYKEWNTFFFTMHSVLKYMMYLPKEKLVMNGTLIFCGIWDVFKTDRDWSSIYYSRNGQWMKRFFFQNMIGSLVFNCSSVLHCDVTQSNFDLFGFIEVNGFSMMMSFMKITCTQLKNQTRSFHHPRLSAIVLWAPLHRRASVCRTKRIITTSL